MSTANSGRALLKKDSPDECRVSGEVSSAGNGDAGRQVVLPPEPNLKNL